MGTDGGGASWFSAGQEVYMVAFAALGVESQTLKKDLTLVETWRLVIADGFYGVSALAVLITGIRY